MPLSCYDDDRYAITARSGAGAALPVRVVQLDTASGWPSGVITLGVRPESGRWPDGSIEITVDVRDPIARHRPGAVFPRRRSVTVAVVVDMTAPNITLDRASFPSIPVATVGDRDGDGIPDISDLCPDEFGGYDGCRGGCDDPYERFRVEVGGTTDDTSAQLIAILFMSRPSLSAPEQRLVQLYLRWLVGFGQAPPRLPDGVRIYASALRAGPTFAVTPKWFQRDKVELPHLAVMAVDMAGNASSAVYPRRD